MHNLDSLLRAEVEAVEPRHLRAAARRCEPGLVGLAAALALTGLVIAVALATHHGPTSSAVPAPRPQPAPTAPGGNP